ncbi:hypothetical protein ACHAPS_005647 [Verticillium nonalfalfae]
MNDLKAPNFIPPWATSLLGGNRKDVAVPSKEAGSHNDNVRTDSAGVNPKLSGKQGDRTANVYQVDSSEAPNDTDGSDEVDDNNDDDDEDGLRNLPRSLSLETEHTDSDAARPQSSSSRAGEKQPSFQSENRLARAESSAGYESLKPKHSWRRRHSCIVLKAQTLVAYCGSPLYRLQRSSN